MAPDRKEDPGERFDWEGLARNGVGLWPDGVPAEFITRATDKVAQINAAWDRIKRERGL